MFKKRWQEFGFGKEIEKVLTNWVREFFHSNESLNNYCMRFGYPDASEKIHRFFVTTGLEQTENWLIENETRLLRNMLPESVQTDVESRIPELANYLAERVQALVQSKQVQHILEQRMERAVYGKGMFSQMARSLIGNLRLARWLQEEIGQIIADRRFQLAIEQLLTDEWEKLLDSTIGELSQKIDNGRVPALLQEVLDPQELFEKPIRDLPLDDVETIVVKTIIPRAVEIGSEKLLEALPRLLEKIDIARLVEDQVNSFSLEELERLILSFTKRELKMITSLGAYLGGLIGFFQWLIMVFF